MMTPERIEEIKNAYKDMKEVGMYVPELLAALEESQQAEERVTVATWIEATNGWAKAEEELAEAQQTIARQREALEFLADDSNWSWWNVGTEDETVTWVGGTDPQHAAREAIGNKEGSDNT